MFDQSEGQTETPQVGETKGERTRARVVRVAQGLFVERGYHGTSMRQIADGAGLALGGIYNHFSSKEDIFVAVMLAHNPYDDIVGALEAARGERVEDLVRDAAAGMLAALGRRPDGLHLLFIEIVEFGGQHLPRLFEQVASEMMGFAQRLVAIGGLRPIPLFTLVRAFVGFFFAYFITDWLIGSQFPLEMKEGAFDDFVDIYLHGILGQQVGTEEGHRDP
jgi:AcrR family transcriptional regulator